MTQIRIQERARGTDGSNAVVSFENGPEYPVTISDPFSEKEDEELEWYFEEHLKFPFTDKVRAQNAAVSIKTYGEALFKQVLGDPNIYAEYRRLLKTDMNGLQVEIVGSPKFHAHHWEAIKDPKLSQPLTLQVTVVRKNPEPQILPVSARPSPTINLLIVTARPSGARDVGYRTISRPLVEALRNANLRVQIEILRPGTYKALENHLRDVTENNGEGYYHVIHFDVHGAVFNNKAFLFFEGEQDNKVGSVRAIELANLLRSHRIPIAILNACQSGKQVGDRETSLGSYLIQAGVQLVLAMGYSVTVSSAELLMRTLYQHFFAGDNLAIAIRHARTELYHNKERRAYFNQRIDLEDWLLPVVYQNQPVTLQPREFTQEERAAWLERKAEEKRYTPPEPTYGFVGRDIDILQIEKRLLTKRNILLVRGMGGAGKTTLLRHLAAWWHSTGFVQRVFYFGYDEKAWTLQQIMTTIAQELYGPRYYTDFQPLSPRMQQAMLAQSMHSNSHLLILDNLESITGAHLVIQHTLPPDEQAALRSFLTDLAKDNTLVLLGSRGREDWLAKGTFDDNIYELPGLDPEAASTLANRILERNNATKYRQDEDLRKLIKVLDGFPLALQVVLANLAHQTPSEVLAALQAGDVSIDPKSDSQDKTESILRCIDYSHGNLSTEAQQLLLCLAPFTSVIWLDMLDQYTNYLRQQTIMATLPFERWPEVLREAENWGLLSPDPKIPRFLRLQPIFPYFLRNHLYALEKKEVRSAVETAFRKHYDQLGGMLYQLLESKEPQKRQVGHILTSLEYENLVIALNLALAAQVSIFNLDWTLNIYLDAIQDQRRGLELEQSVLSHLEAYPAEKLIGPLGVEFATVIDNIARRQLELKQYAMAERSYQKALEVLLKNKSYDVDTIKKLSSATYHQLGRVAQEQRQWEQAEQYYQHALQLKTESNNRYNQADTYHQLGRVAQEQRQWEQAKQYYQHALQIDIEYNDRYAQASIYHQLGMMAQEQQQWKQAERYYQNALRICIEGNYHYDQARVYYQLGRVAQEQRQWEQAEQYYQQVLHIYIESNDRYSQADTYHNLGMVAQEQRQWEQAEQYYQQALQIKIESNDRYAQASIYHRLGRVAIEQRQWEQAKQYYQQALHIYIESNDRSAQANTYHNLGAVAQEQRQWEQAKQYYQQALQISVEYNDTYIGRAVLTSLAYLWEVSGDESLPNAIASIIGLTPAQVETGLRNILVDDPGATSS